MSVHNETPRYATVLLGRNQRLRVAAVHPESGQVTLQETDKVYLTVPLRCVRFEEAENMGKSDDWQSLPQYMMSSRPNWVRLDLAVEKTDEVRRTAPRLDRKKGAVVWLYETKNGEGRGAVVAAFWCPAVHPVSTQTLAARSVEMERRSRLTMEELLLYKGARRLLYFWEIGEIRALTHAIPVSAFGLTCPPQSWCRCKVPEGITMTTGAQKATAI